MYLTMGANYDAATLKV